jgi:hypothetical protein
VFYDEYERVALWGKDLYQHLDDVYRNAARYCVLFVSKSYAKRLWTNHERKSAQARAFSENYEYILPARFDGTNLPGLVPTIGYIDLRQLSPNRFADLVLEKIGPSERQFFLPPIPDRLFTRLELRDKREKDYAVEQAEAFVGALKRMSDTERKLVAYVFMCGCPTDLPANVHIRADLLRRITGLAPSKCIRELERLSSLGFITKVSREKESGADPIIKLTFDVRNVGYDGPEDATGTVHEMVGCLTEEYCQECSIRAILDGDFSALATVTHKPERH